MTVCSFLREFTTFSFEAPLIFGVDDAITGFYRTLVSTWKPVAEMPFSHQQLPASGIEGPSAPDLGKVGGSTAGWVTTGQTTWGNILCRDIHEKTSNWSNWSPHKQSFFFIYCARNQDGRSRQPFGEGENGHKIFCQARIYCFCDKCVVFARKCNFANLTHNNMQYIPCNSFDPKSTFFAHRLPKKCVNLNIATNSTC